MLHIVLVFVPALLIGPLAAADKTVDPAKFTCNKWSPLLEAEFSDTEPQVALTHIFCGQIKVKSTGQKKAEGWHSRPKNKNPSCATASGFQPSYRDAANVYYATKVFIYDAKDMQWIRRDNLQKYYFFPGQWDIVTTVNNLIDVYQRCNGTTSKGDVCIKNYRDGGNPFDIHLFLDDQEPRRIISAFPGPTGSCKQNCQYPLIKLSDLVYMYISLLAQKK